ncbi:MAG: hypothetical protein MJ246_00210 [Clostridia bacterium]|nr:hypothetical protein [Clostridia bacterium]
MNEDKTTYTLEASDTENKTGTSDSTIKISDYKKEYENLYYEGGFVGEVIVDTKPDKFVSEATVAADGSLIINIYYTRNRPSSGGGGGGGGAAATGETTPKVLVKSNSDDEKEDKELQKKIETALKELKIKDKKVTSLPGDVERDGYEFGG